MLIYDSTTIAFSQKAEAFLKEILLSLGFEVRTSRFVYKNYTFPINVVAFEGTEWGHFNGPYMQIGLNRKLIYLAKDSVTRDILKHELAHYLTYIIHRGENIKPHGAEFKAVCAQFGFPEDIAKATMNLEQSNLSKEGDLVSERVIEKVKKLLMLAQSSNANEAELATLKANELLLRHNLDYLKDKQEPVYLDRVLMRTRKDSKISAIYEILKHFIVKPVISMGKNSCCLEVSGSLTNVKLAGYVANFLDQELDHLWELAKKEHGFSGLREKNSFYLGVAKGFDQKMKTSKMAYSDSDKKALMVVEQKLTIDTRMIYSRLSSVRSGHQSDYHASSVGHEKGLSLTIRNAVEGKGKNLYLPER
jgi:hypothetical protein